MPFRTTKRAKPPVHRTFPFRPGAKPGGGNLQRAQDALLIFELLHEAYQNKKLTFEQISPLFFRSTSDLISYREGWKAGKFWSCQAWDVACGQGHTNKLVSEHVLPRSDTLKHALSLLIDPAKDFVWNNSFECVITKDEDRLVNRHAGNATDPWKRYAEAGVKVKDVQWPHGVFFLDKSDRALLQSHSILAP